MEQYHSRRAELVYRELLSEASQGLSFTQDVMWEMGPDGIPYNKADFTWLFRASGPLAPVTSPRRRKSAVIKVMPCHTYPKAKTVRVFMRPPLPVLPPLQTRHYNSESTKGSFMNPKKQGGVLGFFKRTGLKGVSNVYSCLKEWPAGGQEGQEEQDKSGSCDGFVQKELSKTTTQWITGQRIRRQRRHNAGLDSLLKGQHGQCVRRPVCEEDCCRCSGDPKPSTELRALKNSKAKTAQPLYYRARGYLASPVCMERNNETTQHKHAPKPTCPQGSSNFATEKCETKNNCEQGPCSAGTGRVERGTTFSTPADNNRQGTNVPKQQEHYNLILELPGLCCAVEGWRKAWNIKSTWHNVTVKSLKKALTDPDYNIRLVAVAACATRAVKRTQEQLCPDEKAQGQAWKVEAVPAELQPFLLSVLHDPVKKVQMAAAVCHYAMCTPNSHARDILRNAIYHDCSGKGADSLVAAQCLAAEGDTSQCVIERLISQHFFSKTPSDQEQAATLIAKISSKTTLVRSLLAEELNSANWKTRVLACNTISQLKCPINKDITNKLIYMMWNDWSSAVRQAAATTLSKLDVGSVIRDELRSKLQEGPTSRRVEALVLIGQLKIMTARLLPTFQCCLNDDFVAVRKQACLTAASLMMKDETILNHIIHVMRNDPSCDVKVLAINTLAKISCLTPTLKENLQWVLHHEEEPKVRTAACEALKALGVKDPELQHQQERFVMGPNPQADRLSEGLINCTYNLEKDKHDVENITDQVQKLCTKSIITEKVLLLEELEKQHQRNLKRQESQIKTSAMSALLHKRFKELQHPWTRRLSASEDGPENQVN